MNFSRENTKLRTLVVKAVNKTGQISPVTAAPTATHFNTYLSMECPGYDYCYIQLKQVLIDAGDLTGAPFHGVKAYNLFPFMVRARLGQIVNSNTNSFDDFLGSFYCKRDANQPVLNDQPIIELNSIPHGHFEFEITEKDQVVNQDHLVIEDLTLVFSVYFCKR